MNAQERLRVETSVREDRIVLELHGELDLAGAPALEDRVEQAKADPRELLILDVERLDFIDSAGLRTILSAQRDWTSEGRTFAMTPGPPQVQRLLTVAGVREHIPAVASQDEVPAPPGATPPAG